MVGWHHRLNGREFDQTLGDGEGQGGLVCCSPWGCKESDTTEGLKNSTNSHLSLPKRKDPDAGRSWGQEEKGATEDEMAGWHH